MAKGPADSLPLPGYRRYIAKHPQGGRYGHQLSQGAPHYPCGRVQIPVGKSKNKSAGVFSIIINIGGHINININNIINMNGDSQITINIPIIIIINNIEWSRLSPRQRRQYLARF